METQPTLVGRAYERRALRSAMEEAAAGRPGLVLVHGDAGIGKTCLVREAAERALSEGHHVLVAQCRTPMNVRTSVAGRVTTVLCTATTALLPLCSAAQHSAAHDDGSPRAIVRSVDALTPRCPLARVGETYVRCDDLTGNGVRASSRVPG